MAGAEKLAEKVPGWVERLLIPTLESRVRTIMKEEMLQLEKTIDAKFEAVDARFEAFDEKFSARIDAVDEKLSTRIDAVDEKLSNKIDDLDKRLDMVQRLAVVEAKMKDFESKN